MVPARTGQPTLARIFCTAFAGQAVAIKEVHDDIWLVSCMEYDLGYFDGSRCSSRAFGCCCIWASVEGSRLNLRDAFKHSRAGVACFGLDQILAKVTSHIHSIPSRRKRARRFRDA